MPKLTQDNGREKGVWFRSGLGQKKINPGTFGLDGPDEKKTKQRWFIHISPDICLIPQSNGKVK